jgi:hypothetical protein
MRRVSLPTRAPLPPAPPQDRGMKVQSIAGSRCLVLNEIEFQGNAVRVFKEHLCETRKHVFSDVEGHVMVFQSFQNGVLVLTIEGYVINRASIDGIRFKIAKMNNGLPGIIAEPMRALPHRTGPRLILET